MAKKVKRKQSSASLRKEIARLKKIKKVDAERKKLFAARAKEIEEIRELRAEARALKGVGSKRRVAGKIGMQASKAGWKGLKFAGKVIKARLEAEAREQARDAAKTRAKSKPRPKPRKKTKPKRRKR